MIAEVQQYVPGYTLKNGPVFDGRRVSTYLEVAGLGDYLPRYAGNLDIMTAAALRTGELIAEEMSGGAFTRHCEGLMNLSGKKVTLHDNCLRDGMHPKQHQITLAADDRRRHRTRRGRRTAASRSPTATAWAAPRSTTASRRTATRSTCAR